MSRGLTGAILATAALCCVAATAAPCAQGVGDVKADFQTADDYQASYLINQAANELCPVLIWQLRNSAAGYRPQTP